MAPDSERRYVREQLELGRSEEEVAEALGISVPSIQAYKANITRKDEWSPEQSGAAVLHDYLAEQGKYLTVPVESLDNLDDGEKSTLVELLRKAEGFEVEDTSTGIEYALNDLPPSEIRARVHDLRSQGLNNNEVQEHFPADLRRTVGAYLAHETRGTYEDRDLPQ